MKFIVLLAESLQAGSLVTWDRVDHKGNPIVRRAQPSETPKAVMCGSADEGWYAIANTEGSFTFTTTTRAETCGCCGARATYLLGSNLASCSFCVDRCRPPGPIDRNWYHNTIPVADRVDTFTRKRIMHLYGPLDVDMIRRFYATIRVSSEVDIMIGATFAEFLLDRIDADAKVIAELREQVNELQERASHATLAWQKTHYYRRLREYAAGAEAARNEIAKLREENAQMARTLDEPIGFDGGEFEEQD